MLTLLVDGVEVAANSLLSAETFEYLPKDNIHIYSGNAFPAAGDVCWKNLRLL